MFDLILLYHSVSDDPCGKYAHNVSSSNFIQHINFLSHFFEFCHVDDLHNKSNKPRLALTFDDAYMNLFDTALPYLNSRSIPATIYWSPGISPDPFWRDIIREILTSAPATNYFVRLLNEHFLDVDFTPKSVYSLSKSEHVNSLIVHKLAHKTLNYFNLTVRAHTMSQSDIKRALSQYNNLHVGNHSFNHYNLTTLDEDQLSSDVARSHQLLTLISPDKTRSDYFSIPFGGSESFNIKVIQALSAKNYRGCLLSRGRLHLKNYRFSSASNSSQFPFGFLLIERIMPSDTGISGLTKTISTAFIRSIYYRLTSWINSSKNRDFPYIV